MRLLFKRLKRVQVLKPSILNYVVNIPSTKHRSYQSTKTGRWYTYILCLTDPKITIDFNK